MFERFRRKAVEHSDPSIEKNVKVTSLAGLAEAMRKPEVHAAIYEAPPVPAHLDFQTFGKAFHDPFRANLDFGYYGEWGGVDKEKLASVIDVSGERAIALRGARGASKETVRALNEVVEFFKKDLLAIISHFPVHKVHQVSLRVEKVTKGFIDHDFGFHVDEGFSDGIRIVRAYDGQSTLYAENKKGFNTVRSKSGAISAHKLEVSWHRRPPLPKDRYRVALVLFLRPNKAI